MTTKRARFDPSAQLPAEGQANAYTSPMATATQHIRDHLLLLRPELTTILEKHASGVLKTRVEVFQKQRTFTGIETDDTLIPRSARVKFDLTTKFKPVEISPEFMALKDEAATLVADLQKNLKAKIVAASKLDTKFMEQAHRTELARAIRLSTTASLVAEGLGSSATDTDRMVNTILDRNHEELLKNCSPNDLESFRTLYKETHGLTELPAPRALTTMAGTRASNTVTTDRGDSIALNYDLLGDGSRIDRAPDRAPALMVSKADREIMKIIRLFDSIFVVP